MSSAAVGCGTTLGTLTAASPGDTQLGDDDVTEHIGLNASSMPLLDLCRYAHRMGAWWLTLNVISLTEYRVEFARRGIRTSR
ncbi:hypothetical protein [Catellatospora paridis]|uniref:hypothetical protein n=1 Tax=Catellatospora paridis TaxID=1617086 RepID=UPI0012D3C822|nr:hypothetical protein [Catellatospora paridis]